MKLTHGLASLVLLGAAIAPIAAQGNAQCNSYATGPAGSARAANVCNAGVDATALFAPVAGILITAGNPVLGSPVRGILRLGLTLRVNATKIVIPDVHYDGSGPVAAGQSAIAPAPLVEAALGIFPGIDRGNLAVEFLGSAQLLPINLFDNVRIDVNATHIGDLALGLGYGGRLTLLAEARGRPNVAVAVMRRTLPRIGVGDVLSGDRYTFASNLEATEYRATIGKQFGLFRLSGGGGWTDYHADAVIQFVHPVTGVPQAPIPVVVDDSRATGFVDAAVGAGGLRLVGEAGIQVGKKLDLVTTFRENDPATRRIFGSVGIRVGF